VSFWLVFALIALGYLLRMAGERPNRFADVDALVKRDRARASMRDA
jgi:hypothetical protein